MPSDTSTEAAAIQRDIFRRMTPEQRLHLALEMSESMGDVALAGLRSRRPDLRDDQLLPELMRIMYGSSTELFRDTKSPTRAEKAQVGHPQVYFRK